MILTIDKEGNAKVFDKDKKIQNKGSLVVAMIILLIRVFGYECKRDKRRRRTKRTKRT